MTRRGSLLLLWLCVGLLPYAAGAAGKPPAHVQRAMKEMWRRGTCLLSSVHKPAAREAALPSDLGDTPVLYPHVHARNGTILCYAVDGGTLWAADDEALHEVDAAAGTLRKTYDRSAGLPDEPIQSIAPAGKTVWLATRGHLVRLNVSAGRATVVPGVRFGMGRLAVSPSGVWLVSDAGAWRLPPGANEWTKLPEFPGRGLLADQVRKGFWWNWWHRRMRVLLPSVFATGDGLYVVCMNRLGRYDPGKGTWQELGRNVWQAAAGGRTVWALVTDGVLRYDAATGKTTHYRAGAGPAAGRPVAMAAGEGAFFLASQPDYDDKPKTGRRGQPGGQPTGSVKLVGGGISRLDLATGTWTVTQAIDGVDVRFATAVQADGREAWAACILYDKMRQRGAHPGMAHVKSWRPHASGLGLLHHAGEKWHLARRQGLKTERRWVMGQRGTVKPDRVGPESVHQLCRCGRSVWGVYRVVPEQYYAGYFISAGCLAAQSDGGWKGSFDCRTGELGFAGEQPELMLISHSHGHRIVLADGHPIALGIEAVAGRAWLVSEAGLFVHDDASDKFRPVLRQSPRVYWRATAAAVGGNCLWIGGDGGTVSRLDRRTGRTEILGVAEGRTIERIAVAGGGVLVKTARTDAVLPVGLASAPKLPAGEVLAFDGKKWTAASGAMPRQATPFRFEKQGRRYSNYLRKDGRRVAFVKGLFRPIVLCEEPAAGRLWLGVYSGVASVPLPGLGK